MVRVKNLLLFLLISPIPCLGQSSSQSLPAPRKVMEGTDVISPGDNYSSQMNELLERHKSRALHNLRQQAGQKIDKPVTPGENSGLKNQTAGIAADQSSDNELNSANPLEQASLEPLAIKRIHMLLDASERQHLFENLANYSNVLSQYHVSPGKVYIFGQPEIPSDAPYDWMRILAKGGKIGANYKIAEIYGITRSPSWILETEEGDVVFEAYESIDRFLTHKGELKRKYLEPEMDPIVGAEDEST